MIKEIVMDRIQDSKSNNNIIVSAYFEFLKNGLPGHLSDSQVRISWEIQGDCKLAITFTPSKEEIRPLLAGLVMIDIESKLFQNMVNLLCKTPIDVHKEQETFMSLECAMRIPILIT